MKKILLPLLCLMLIITACSRSEVNESSTDTLTDTSSYESTADILNAFSQAEEAYEWFTQYSKLSIDEEKAIDIDGFTYCKVNDNRFNSRMMLKNYLLDYFDSATVDLLMDTQTHSDMDLFLDTDCDLYTYHDLFGMYEYEINNRSFSVKTVSDSEKILILNIEYSNGDYTGSCEYNYNYKLTGGKWVFTNFKLPYQVVVDNVI